MSNNIDHSTLSWVKQEIDETLKQARHSLEEYVDNPGDVTQLRFTYNYIHQVHGTLQMVELHGAARLTDELEKLAQSLMNEEISQPEGAYELFMRAIIQLPDYLEKILSGLKDDPLILLPLLNDLRSARGEQLLSENALFSPNVDINISVPVKRNETGANGQDIAKKLRHKFQVGLLGWYRNQDPKGSLEKLGMVLGELEKSCADESVVRLWWVAGGLIESLHDNGLQTSVAMNKILGQIDRAVKRLIDIGEEALADDDNDELLTEILYKLAIASSDGVRITEIRKQFKLEEMAASNKEIEQVREALGGPNAALLETVSVAVKEYLTQVKDALDIFLRGDRTNIHELHTQSELLRKIADTLSMLSLEKERELILTQETLLDQMVTGQLEPTDDALMDVAHQLLTVESAIERLAKQKIAGADSNAQEFSATKLDAEELTDIQGTLLEEIAVNMAKIKDAIVSYIDSPAEHALLVGVPQLFSEVQGGMKMIDLERPCSLIAAVARYVETELITNKHQPGQEELDGLADAIASVEYYLEAIPEQRPGAESMLHVAAQALEKLGYPAEELVNTLNQVEVAPKAEKIEEAVIETPAVESIENITLEIVDIETEEDLISELVEDIDVEEIELSAPPESDISLTVDATELEVEELEDEITLEAVPEVIPESKSESAEIVHSEGKPLSEEEIAKNKAASQQLMDDVDDDILSIFIEEVREEMEVINEMLPMWKQNTADTESLGRIRRAFHTLKGSGRLVGATIIGEFAWAFESMLNKVLDKAIPVTPSVLDVLSEGTAALPGLIDQVEHHTDPGIDVDALSQRAFDITDNKKAAPESAPAPIVKPVSKEAVASEQDTASDFMDPVLYDIFSKESQGHLKNIKKFVSRCGQDKICIPDEDLVRALHTLHGSARMAGSTSIADIAGLLEKFTKTAMGNESPLQREGVQILDNAVQLVDQMLTQINTDKPKSIDSRSLLDRLQELYATEKSVEDRRLSEEQTRIDDKPNTDDVAAAEVEQHDYDVELLEVFLEEGSEIIEASEGILGRMSESPNDPGIISELQRELHTLKGGARMAGIVAIGDLSHSVESLLTDIAEERMSGSAAVVGVLQQSVDRLYNMLELAQQRSVIHDASELIEVIEQVRKDKGLAEIVVPESVIEPTPEKPAVSEGTADLIEFPVAPPLKRAVVEIAPKKESIVQEAAAGGGALQDAIRVRSDLLDNLVNFSGEVSIYRSRLEQQNTEMGSNLDEMGTTVSRLQDQLRKLEMETEAQILFNYEKEGGDTAADFDPLEMDRYSQVQELSRGLSESISDISSIKGLLDNLKRESETLLLQQSRVNTELQEGLMNTRMVPFSGIVTRLRRLVRQTSQELGKDAELEVIGEQGEIDRTVLERITAPIEHMLRNAISHGLESAEERKLCSKPAKGSLKIEITRQGSEVLLKISDDGAGMNLSAIRKRAIQRGLISSTMKLSDHDLIQFVLESGFSTAEKVTQVSGRGVGMDVVNSEIKQLGGSFDINSTEKVGTVFSVLLPLTMAMNHAVLAKIGEETYAIALSGIEGIVRLSKEDVESYASDPKKVYEYSDQKYIVRRLGVLLGTEDHGHTSGNILPVLLVRSGDQRIALQVDQLLGSREIVVKSVGAQISNVRGVSGATILGDGQVVLILDMSALLRMGTTMQAMARVKHDVHRTADDRATIMVVDDSITVRKVTTRLLERNDLNAITARDGVDAIALLEEQIPDVMLLDIEMPRMDGFELATYMRNDPGLRHIPIIMITSRTGDKHRKRAMDIGVNDYLGKPYQETDLLARIHALIEVKAGDA